MNSLKKYSANIASPLYLVLSTAVARHRLIVVTGFHVVLVALANYLAFFIRFDGHIPQTYLQQMAYALPVLLAFRLLGFFASSLHSDFWRYSSIGNLLKIFNSTTLGTLAFFLTLRYGLDNIVYPRSIYVLDWMIFIMLTGGMRFAIRAYHEGLLTERKGPGVLIIGAGDAGEMLVRDIKNNPRFKYRPLGFVDDNIGKTGLRIHGVPILGTTAELPGLVDALHPEEFIICIPSADPSTLKRIMDLLIPYKLPIKTLPNLADTMNEAISAANLKPLSLEDLLRRKPVRTDLTGVRELIEGKTVLVTGAGGSIGSELSRQIARYSPARLILVDRYENGLFSVDSELRPALDDRLLTVILDITDRGGLNSLFAKQTPALVFHAAAHKHVPLMELNPLEAIKNNVFGTLNVIEAARAAGAENFVLISTDKAVNPTSVMGATKRITEYLALDAQRQNTGGGTSFKVVRFGNVLGSNGSVFHIFQEQLKAGGPLTVTHPDITRYFMLIPEAVQLVLLAASQSEGGQILVLDMGQPIRIKDLAEHMVGLAGLVPDRDIKIKYVGLRPGEKLHEELFDSSEKAAPAVIKDFQIALPSRIPSHEEIREMIEEALMLAAEGDPSAVQEFLAKRVPGFRPPSQ